MKIHSHGLHSPLCGIFIPNSVNVAHTPQKAIFKHALVQCFVIPQILNIWELTKRCTKTCLKIKKCTKLPALAIPKFYNSGTQAVIIFFIFWSAYFLYIHAKPLHFRFKVFLHLLPVLYTSVFH